MRAKELPPIELLREKYIYDPETGDIFSKIRGMVIGMKRYQRGRPAMIAIRYYVEGGWQKFQDLPAHRVAFALMGDTLPLDVLVDHIDTNPFNNRWNNLRRASNQENKRNGGKYRPQGKPNFIGPLLPKGVRFYNRKFRAIIKIGDKAVHLGMFSTPEAAAEAFGAAAAANHGEFVRL